MCMKAYLIAAIMIIAVVFLLQRFPVTGAAAFQPIPIPVHAHIVTEPSGFYTSHQKPSNIAYLIKEANRIWEPASIEFRLESVSITPLGSGTIPSAINSNLDGLEPVLIPGKVNLFFVQSLNNINGLTLVPIRSVLIADHTSVNTDRTVAHELGHILGLGHVQESAYLMAQGKNGELLSAGEIRFARENALTQRT